MTDSKEQERSRSISPRRLWFGFAGAAVAWIIAGLVDVLLAWQGCMGGEAGSSMFTQTGIWIGLGIITFGLLVVAVASGVISFRNWRTLSDSPDFVSAEARGRSEFMALFGVAVAATLSIGIVWFAIPIYLLRFCERVH